jgi:ABC-type siderophore export system fused ATPase/permease subunit
MRDLAKNLIVLREWKTWMLVIVVVVVVVVVIVVMMVMMMMPMSMMDRSFEPRRYTEDSLFGAGYCSSRFGLM